jgi:hypothetical protein
MPRRTVDLASYINRTVERGHPADFPVTLKPLFRSSLGSFQEVPHRLAVVREDTGDTLAVVSDRYTLVPHDRILDLVQEAIAPLDVGPVPRGVYVDRKGARMQAIFKFPALAQPVRQQDDICPCLKVRNTYDGTSRIAVHIGAFRFVCTNLAVGGGGVFAGGFMSVHAGAIRLEDVGAQLASYLKDFDAIVALYRSWAETPVSHEAVQAVLEILPTRAGESISVEIARKGVSTIFEAYNAATYYATHQARSFRVAFELLARVNRGFQERFPAS